MKNISEPFIRRPVMTFLLAASVAVAGFFCYKSLPVNDLPSVEYPVIQVQAVFPGMDPSAMAANVATPLEKEFLKIQGLDMVTSTNMQGITSITLQFNRNRSIDDAAGDVQCSIQRCAGSLPADMPMQPTFEKSDPNSQPIFFLTLCSDTMTAGQLYDFATENVAQRFNTVDGVSKTDVFGMKRAVRIYVDPQKLYARRLTMVEVAQKIQQSTASLASGSIRGNDRTWVVCPDGQLTKAEDYGGIVIAVRDGIAVHLRDVADCVESQESDTFTASFWIRERGSFNASVMMAVTRAAGANTIAVAKSLRALIPEIRKELPDSVFMRTVYDRSKSIVESIGDVKWTVVLAFALVTAVIFLFLGRLRETLIPAVALPLSLLMLFIFMQFLNYSIDNLSLMAITLAVGFLVDDAIVFLENVVRRMGKLGETPEEASLRGADEISSTIVSMTLALVSIFIPLMFLGGQIGRVFHEFSAVIMVATLASGIVSLTVTPLMCANMLRPHSESEGAAKLGKFGKRLGGSFLDAYGKALNFCMERRWLSICCWSICLVGTFVAFRHLPKSFLPDGDSGMLRGVFIAQEGTSFGRMAAHQTLVDEALRSNPAVDCAFSATGFSMLAGNQGVAMSFLRPAKERDEIHRVANQVMGKLSMIPGAMAFMQPVPALRIQTGTTSANQGKYSYTISGIDRSAVYGAAQKLMGALRPYKGIASISSDMFLNSPNISVQMNRDQLAAYGGTVLDLEQQMKAAYSDNFVYLIKAPTQQYKVILSVAKEWRSSVDDLGRIYCRNGAGEFIDPLTAAHWVSTTGPLSVNHTNNFPSATLFFNLSSNVEIGDAMAHIEKTAAQIIPQGISGKFMGEAKTFAETFASLKVLIFASIFITYVILGILYESYAHPLTVLSSLPVAAFGGFLTLIIFRQPLSLYAYIGLFMLLGIVEKNGIMIVDFAIQRQQLDGMSPRDAIHLASLQRLRPILMTTLAMVMGVMPICLGLGADGSSRRSLGLVVAGGMLFAQVLTLFVTPIVYLFVDDFQTKVLDKISLFRRGNVVGQNASDGQ
ncbi:MAG: efflux RND transporter permease subunit [Puniceicoccales bacterium]|jgi:HAE1 family hydrophobic/amphiphilic exporter-1|nr:efflux RND transporter permease subunit [Puniceicoccales bacterium]